MTDPNAMDQRFVTIEERGRDDATIAIVAEDTRLGRRVILKRLLPRWRNDLRWRRRLAREGRAIAQMRSPRVLGLYDSGEDDDGPFLALEAAVGETLADRVRRQGPLGLDAVLQIGQDLCESVAAVHRVGLVHGNIYPHQVVFDDEGERFSPDSSVRHRFPERTMTST